MSIVLAMDAYGSDRHVEQEVLAPLGAEVHIVARDPAARDEELRRAVALLVVDHPVDSGLLSTAPNCGIVATYGVGVDNIDLEAARRRGVIVANVPDYCHDEVAEHAIALWLACERRIVRGDAMVRRGDWDNLALTPMRRIRGLTFGLIGFGRIGRQVALRARGFGVSLVAFDPAISGPVRGLEFVEVRTDLYEVLRSADVVSLHVPLVDRTRHLIDAGAISAMGPGTVLINTSRGGLVDEAALLDALRSGRLAGAGLDVLSPEPPRVPFAGLGIENLVVTPHMAFLSTESEHAAKRGAAEAVAQFLRNEPVTNRVA
jgi:D-3-phosphoglycerate dehydrogenase / 2-oxoglutarate reductase